MTLPAAALVRDVSPRLTDALLTFQARTPIDIDRAREQHAAYVALLRSRGIEVVALPPLPDHPDGVFVEDTVVIVDDLAVLTRPGDPTRRAEPHSAATALEQRGYDVVRVDPPGRLDGGDVLAVGDTLYIGEGARTDAAGVRAVAAAVGRRRRVVGMPVHGALHLKTAVTALPDGTLIGLPDHLDIPALTPHQVVAAPEATGANVLVLGETVVVSASAPRTAALVADRGFEVVSVEIDELEQAEAGLTCLSVLLPR